MMVLRKFGAGLFRGRAVRCVVLLGMLGFGSACQVATSRLIKPERRVVAAVYQTMMDDAAAQGLEIRRVTSRAADGVHLACLVVTRRAGSQPPPAEVRDFLGALPAELRGAAPGSRGTVMLLHGFKNRKEQWLPMARELAWAGFTCVLADSRAHGESDGTYATFGYKEARDTRVIWQEVKKSVGLPNAELSLVGYSMGGAVALEALDVLPEVKRVVTLATFDRLDRVMWDQAAPRFHWLTRPALSAVCLSAQVRTGMNPKEIRPCDCAARHTAPLLIIHGAEDRFVHPQASEVLEKSAKGPCRRILVPGKNHWSLFYDKNPRLHAGMAGFLAGGIRD